MLRSPLKRAIACFLNVCWGIKTTDLEVELGTSFSKSSKNSKNYLKPSRVGILYFVRRLVMLR
jgi:hypothetical protein